MTPDLINGLFEFCGSLFIVNNCRITLRDKDVAGVSWLSTSFFSAWGVWNLFFYPTLGQWWSFAGGMTLAAATTVWVGLLWKYRRRYDNKTEDEGCG